MRLHGRRRGHDQRRRTGEDESFRSIDHPLGSGVNVADTTNESERIGGEALARSRKHPINH
jgi:hypothetical protein